MRRVNGTVATLWLVAMLASRLAAAQPDAALLASQHATGPGSARLDVTAPAFATGAAIPDPYGQEGDRMSPALSWKGAPEGTRSFVVMVEDPDAKEPRPFLHWSLYDLPATITQLAESVPAVPQLPHLQKARQGRNSRGTVGYTGPRPPIGDPPHHYHFQVFALDTMLALPPGSERAALLSAMKGHVLASGEVVGTFQRR